MGGTKRAISSVKAGVRKTRLVKITLAIAFMKQFTFCFIAGATTVETLATTWQPSVPTDLYQRDATTVRLKIT